MLSVDQTVDFLIRNNALKLGDSPWPNRDESEDVFPIDWERIFPRRRSNIGFENGSEYNDNQSLQLSPDESEALNDALNSGPPSQPSDTPSDFDTHAWYQPIHFFGHDWGIFIREDCVKRTALEIARFIPAYIVTTVPKILLWKILNRAAFAIYFLHEHYHHKIECLGLRLHVVMQKSCYLQYNELVYKANEGTDNQLEEALANADCYKRLGLDPYALWLTAHERGDVATATKCYLKWKFPSDPPGYRMAKNYLTNSAFEAGEHELLGRIKEATLTPAQPASDWDLAPRMTQSFFPITSNIWTVIPAGSRAHFPVTHTAPIRTCSTQEMVRLLIQAGYEMVNGGGKGSHIKLQKAGMPRSMVLTGNQSNLSPGVAKTALRVLGDYNLSDLPNLIKCGLK